LDGKAEVLNKEEILEREEGAKILDTNGNSAGNSPEKVSLSIIDLHCHTCRELTTVPGLKSKPWRWSSRPGKMVSELFVLLPIYPSRIEKIFTKKLNLF